MTSDNHESKRLTAEELVDLPSPGAVRISRNGKYVVYTTKPMGRKDEHDKSSIWLADIGVEHSARQLTSGSFNDRNPEWSPDGKSIAFISDRAEAGKKCAIYMLSIGGGEAYAITDASHERNTAAFAWSPNGNYIAFLSADEKSEEKKKKDEKKDDVKVYGEDWEFNRLRLLHVATRQVTVLFKEESHVSKIGWSSDSTQIAAVVHQTPELDSPFVHGSRLEILSAAPKSKKTLLNFAGAITSDPVWHNKDILFTAGASPNMISTSQTLYAVDLESGTQTILSSGDTGSTQDLRNSFGTISLLIACDLHDNIVTMFHPTEEQYSAEQSIEGYDVVKTKDGHYITAFSTGMVSAPTEVFSKTSATGQVTQLSTHGAPAQDKISAIYKSINCKSYDGQFDIDAVWAAPAAVDNSEPLPTIVHIHGGPPDRVTNSFEHFGFRWMPWIMSQDKYGFLSVNYRGGIGRGEKFSAAAAGGVGTVEYDDVLALVEEGIRRGLVDETQLIVMGWSQGGFLSYLSAVRNGAKTHPDGAPKTWKFKGAICGAGVTDWDMMSMSSDVPAFESELAGGTPWSQGKNWIKGRQGSAIWEFAEARESIPPILILHGEKDERVPLTQAVAFHRGCLKWGLSCEMAVYPREPHGIKERAHLVDMLKRIIRFVDTHIG